MVSNKNTLHTKSHSSTTSTHQLFLYTNYNNNNNNNILNNQPNSLSFSTGCVRDRIKDIENRINNNNNSNQTTPSSSPLKTSNPIILSPQYQNNSLPPCEKINLNNSNSNSSIGSYYRSSPFSSTIQSPPSSSHCRINSSYSNSFNLVLHSPEDKIIKSPPQIQQSKRPLKFSSPKFYKQFNQIDNNENDNNNNRINNEISNKIVKEKIKDIENQIIINNSSNNLLSLLKNEIDNKNNVNNINDINNVNFVNNDINSNSNSNSNSNNNSNNSNNNDKCENNNKLNNIIISNNNNFINNENEIEIEINRCNGLKSNSKEENIKINIQEINQDSIVGKNEKYKDSKESIKNELLKVPQEKSILNQNSTLQHKLSNNNIESNKPKVKPIELKSIENKLNHFKQIDRINSPSSLAYSYSSPALPSPKLCFQNNDNLKVNSPINLKSTTIIQPPFNLENNNNHNNNNNNTYCSNNNYSNRFNYFNNNNSYNISYLNINYPILQKSTSSTSAYTSYQNSVISSSYPSFKNIKCQRDEEDYYNSLFSNIEIRSSGTKKVKPELKITYEQLESYLKSYFDLHYQHFSTAKPTSITPTSSINNLSSINSSSNNLNFNQNNNINSNNNNNNNNNNSNSFYNKFEVYEKSLNALKSRLAEVYIKFHKRNNLKYSKQVCKDFSEVLYNVSRHIENFIPCSSTFEGDTTLTCCNVKKNHQFHYASKNQIFEKSGILSCLKSKKVVPYSVTWSGEFNSIIIFTDLNSYLESEFDKMSNDFFDNYLQFINNCLGKDIINSFKVCFGCLLDTPSISCEPCGHIICDQCVVNDQSSSRGRCTICRGGQIVEKEVDLSPLMGYRVLSLDGGGGIRSIVQCIMLDEIEKQLYGTPISDLFDYMIGSSTGGIVALSLATTNKSPLQLVDLFDKMAKKVYKTNTLYKINCRATKYRNEEMIKLLSQTLSSNIDDINSFKKVKVAVTSVLDENLQLGNEKDALDYNEHIKPCIFPFYSRIPTIDSINEVRKATVLDASLATCSTPSFFPSFKIGNNKYRDGAILNRNPCKIGLFESQQLWNHNNMDLFLSLGNGIAFKDSNNNSVNNNNSLTASQSFINSESENTFKEMVKDKPYCEVSFRLNPELSKHVSLDSSDENSRNLLKSESRNFIVNNQIFNNVSSKLLSSLFYLDNIEYDKNINQVRGIIKCRLKNVPSQIVNQLNIKSFVTEQCDIELLDINLSPFSIPFKITSPPINNEIDIKCNLVCLNGRTNNNSISGCPFNLNKINK